MKIVIGSDGCGIELKQRIKQHLLVKGYSVLDVTEDEVVDFVESSKRVAKTVVVNEADRGILVDAYGSGSFMVASKHKFIVCAQIGDEHSARMTREHNNTTIITIGVLITGEQLALSIVDAFLSAEYAGGRHQIRVDMLNKLC